ncbi:MAG: DUF4124 domain-containing protein [Burkholderiales bacterium]|nr:DUF4124 domain-containing protein [Burkholderiales bacterium]
MKKLSAVLMLFTFSLASSAELHRWVDAQGHVYYSDQAPSGFFKHQKVLPAQHAAAAPVSDIRENSAAPKTLVDKELEFRKRRIEAEEARIKQEKERATDNAARQNCTLAKNDLKNLQEGGRLVRYDERGERAFLTDHEREARAEEAEKAVEQWCGQKNAQK